MSAELAITGIKKELEGQRDQALADLRVYLSSPVGVGEHSRVSEEVKKIINRVSEADSVLDTLGKYIQEAPAEGQEAQENAPVVE